MLAFKTIIALLLLDKSTLPSFKPLFIPVALKKNSLEMFVPLRALF